MDELQARFDAGDTSVAARLARHRRRLQDLQHFERRVRVSDGWTTGRIDALIESIRERGLDVDAILEGLYERRAEDGP